MAVELRRMSDTLTDCSRRGKSVRHTELEQKNENTMSPHPLQRYQPIQLTMPNDNLSMAGERCRSAA